VRFDFFVNFSDVTFEITFCLCSVVAPLVVALIGSVYGFDVFC